MKKPFHSLLLLLFLPFALFAQDIAALQKEAERLEPFNQEAAFNKYQEILKVQPINIFALAKSSELCSLIGHRQPGRQAKVNYYNAARRFAETALKLDANNAEANFAMSVAMGRMALISTGKQKIEAVSEIKKYAEIAIRNDPNNFKAYHVLGKWHYEVSDLNAFERATAKLLYGGLPPASLSQSIAYYEKSKVLGPDFLLNYLELAKAYYRNNQKDKAIDLLNKLLVLPNKNEDDATIKQEARQLLKEWR